MKILLVDNGSVFIKKIENALSKHTVTKISRAKIKSEIAKKFDAVIFSGGSLYEVRENPKKFEEQFKIVKSGKPVLGICLGFQIICYTFGEIVEPLGKEIEHTQEIQKIKKDPLLEGLGKIFKGYKAHKWGVKSIEGALIKLAKSKDCIEAVKHPKLPVYGVQFHPEADKKLDGYKVIDNFLKIYAKNKHHH